MVLLEWSLVPKAMHLLILLLVKPESESNVTMKFYHWHKNESGYLSKMQVTLDVFEKNVKKM